MKWIKGDLHAHSHNCEDGTLSVLDIVKRSREYCDFIAISGHAYDVPEWGRNQHEEIEKARRMFPDMPIFHSAEQEFPIERHTMFLTAPDNREKELQRELIKNFHRQNGNRGVEKAMEALKYAEENFGRDKVFMIFNHPNSPDVPAEVFSKLAESPVFKVIACVDRRERRAPQTWDIGAEWDKLLSQGFRIFARCGSDFHKHFTDGGDDYLPGEFVQDQLRVEENTYDEIIKAYRTGNFFCMVDNCIAGPVFEIVSKAGADRYNIRLEFTANHPFESIDIISGGKSVKCFTEVPEGKFTFEGEVAGSGYFRVRGAGKMKQRKYTDGEFQPMFLLNPVFTEEAE